MFSTECDTCWYYDYDEEYDEYYCMMDLDEDEVYRIMNSRSQHCPSSRLPRPGVRTQHACPTHWHTHLGHQGLKSPKRASIRQAQKLSPREWRGLAPEVSRDRRGREGRTPDSQCIIFPSCTP